VSLAQLQYPPPTERGMDEWLHAHVRHHEALIQAINEKFGTSLTISQPIWPVDVKDKNQMAIWGRAHLTLHNEMNDILNIPGQDISAPDFSDKRKADGFFFTHQMLHQAAAQLCGQPV